MQMRDILGLAIGATAAALAPAAIAQTAAAKATVDTAKAAGVVGEQADGFLGFVTQPADPAIRTAVAEINAARAQLYRETAARQGVTPDVVGAATFKQVVELRLKAGEYYRPQGGAWVKK